MKKNLLIGLAALAAVTITSCQKDQVINQVPQEQAIEFGTYVGRDAQTKGSVTDINTLCGNTKGFGVFAYYTGQDEFSETSKPNFMYNQRVYGTASGNPPTYTWTYSPIKYWPNNPGDQISFFAYAPYDVNSGVNNNTALEMTGNNVGGAPIITYNVKEDVSLHTDLTYAVLDDGSIYPFPKNMTKPTIDSEIKLLFKHALSRIGFKVEAVIDKVNPDDDGQLDDEEDSDEIEIATGTTIAVSSVSITGNFATSAKLNLSTGSWSDLTNDNSTTFTLTTNEFESVASNVSKSPVQLNKSDEYLMIVPYKFDDETPSSITDGKCVEITVVYTVTTADPNLASSSVITNTITSDPFEFNFEMGKAYNFVLHLGLNSVKFDASVSNWDTPNGYDYSVNVPINQ